MKRFKRIDPERMSRRDLDQLYAAAEKVTGDKTRPLSPEARQAVTAALRKAGRPRIGAGAKRINVTVEQTLLHAADVYGRRHGLSRAALVAEGLRKVIAA